MEIKTEIKKAGQYYIYTPKESSVFIAPIFIELNLLNSITRYSILNLTQNGQETLKAWGRISFTPFKESMAVSESILKKFMPD